MGDIGAGPAQPVLSLCAHPRCLFGFFLGIQKEARRRKRRNPPDPAPQVPNRRALVRWTAEEGGTPLPRLLPCSQRSRVVEVTTYPAPPRNLCPTPHKGAPSNGETAAQGNPPRQRQRWGEQHQSPPHPRLCVALPCPLIGGPRKKGGPGGRQHGERGRRAEVRPVAPPGASLASFWASRKKLAAASGEIPQARHRRCQTTGPWCGGP